MTIRVLIVDDYEPWLRVIKSTLQSQAGLDIVGEASDGLHAIAQARELRPDLIILDIGLPRLNGIEAARRIRALSPNSRILFVSQQSSPDLVQAALDTGAYGYVVKENAGSQLLPVVKAVLAGKQFVGAGLSPMVFVDTPYTPGPNGNSVNSSKGRNMAPSPFRKPGHVVQFYTDDASLLDGVSALFADALSIGESAMAVMTDSRRMGLEERLIARGIDVEESRTEGRLSILDAFETLDQFMDGGMPNRERFLLQFRSRIDCGQATALKSDRPLIGFGEMVSVLWSQQNYDAAIQLEELWNELALTYPLYVCCAYPLNEFQGKSEDWRYGSICGRHSEVVSAF